MKINKKILISLSVLAAVSAVVVGATTAFFTDTETSIGNTLSAGSIDLGISNQSYYNGAPNSGTSWSTTFDLDDGSGPADGAYLYLNFEDLKPGDWGEDTIDIRVHDNEAWVCADVTLTSDAENDLREPELDLGDTSPDGELADLINFRWWADDGDNVWEANETLLPAGPLGVLGVDGSATVAIADSNGSIFDDDDLSESGAVKGTETYYIGKYWCFGDIHENAVPAGQGIDPTVNPGFVCDGSGVDNDAQSDSLTATISFSAVQERNNPNFVCGGSQ